MPAASLTLAIRTQRGGRRASESSPRATFSPPARAACRGGLAAAVCSPHDVGVGQRYEPRQVALLAGGCERGDELPLLRVRGWISRAIAFDVLAGVTTARPRLHALCAHPLDRERAVPMVERERRLALRFARAAGGSDAPGWGAPGQRERCRARAPRPLPGARGGPARQAGVGRRGRDPAAVRRRPQPGRGAPRPLPPRAGARPPEEELAALERKHCEARTLAEAELRRSSATSPAAAAAFASIAQRSTPRQHLDGKFLVSSSDDALTPAQMALYYKQLKEARVARSEAHPRPALVYPRKEDRIRAHVLLSFLALL